MIWQAKPRLVPAQEDCEAHPQTILEAGQSLEVVQNALRRVLGMDRRQDKPIRPRVPQPETGEKWVRFETGARGCKLHNRAREHTMLCMPGGMTQSLVWLDLAWSDLVISRCPCFPFCSSVSGYAAVPVNLLVRVCHNRFLYLSIYRSNPPRSLTWNIALLQNHPGVKMQGIKCSS